MVYTHNTNKNPLWSDIAYNLKITSVRLTGGGEGVYIKKSHDSNGILCDLKGVLNEVFTIYLALRCDLDV